MAFGPTILILATISAVSILYLRWVGRRYSEHLKSVAWQRRHWVKITLMIGTPKVNILAPALEELVFRAPLIVAFDAMTSQAWWGVVLSAAVFAASHWRGKKIFVEDIVLAHTDGTARSDSVAEEVARLQQQNRRTILFRKCFQVALTFVLGLLAGYYGVAY